MIDNCSRAYAVVSGACSYYVLADSPEAAIAKCRAKPRKNTVKSRLSRMIAVDVTADAIANGWKLG